MSDSERPTGSWWQTMPGVLTATAAIITAATGLIVALHQAGLFAGGSEHAVPGRAEDKPARAESAAANAPSRLNSPAKTSATPAESARQPSTATQSNAMNLLSPENGGQLLLAPNDAWKIAIDGKENQYEEVQVGEEAVFAFKNEQSATFASFGMLIPKSGRNPKAFELFVASESPAGPFRSIGTFEPQNVRMMKTNGWQDFSFAPVTAKYLKVKLRSNYEDVVWIDVYEFRLSGTLHQK